MINEKAQKRLEELLAEGKEIEKKLWIYYLLHRIKIFLVQN